MTTLDNEPRRMLLPDSPEVRAVFGADACGKRALRLRLKRAEKRGLLPPRRYLSAARYGWWKDEFLAAVAKLPESYASLPTLVEG